MNSSDQIEAERVQMRAALERCQKILAHLIDPANKGSGISNMVAWIGCVGAEKAAREALALHSEPPHA